MTDGADFLQPSSKALRRVGLPVTQHMKASLVTYVFNRVTFLCFHIEILVSESLY